MSKTHSIHNVYAVSVLHIQWISAHIGLPSNTLGTLVSEAKWAITFPWSTVPVDLAMYGKGSDPEDGTRGVPHSLGNLHSATHLTLTGDISPQSHWRLGWSRSQCITVAQLRTGHSPLLASYLHRIGLQRSPVCPHCDGDETAQHLLHRRHICPPTQPTLDTRGPFWSQLGSYTPRPATRNKREEMT